MATAGEEAERRRSPVSNDIGELKRADLLRAAYPGIVATGDAASAVFGQLFTSVDALVTKSFSNALAVYVLRPEPWGIPGDVLTQLTVVLPEGMFVRNRSLSFEGIPFDIFVFGIDALEKLVARAKRTANASALLPIALGAPIFDPTLIADEIKYRIALIYNAGPSAPEISSLNRLRWLVTRHLIDFSSTTASEDLIAIALTAYQPLADLLFSINRCWRQSGRWIIPSDESGVAEKISALNATYREVLQQGDKNGFLEAALAVLDQAGGPLAAGYVNIVNFRDHGPDGE